MTFRPGDRVILTQQYASPLHVVNTGTEGTVQEYEPSDDLLRVAWDSLAAHPVVVQVPAFMVVVSRRRICGPTRSRLGLLADAGWLCDVVEQRYPSGVNTDDVLREAVRAVRASIALHDGDTVPAPSEVASRWRSNWPKDWPACVTASCDEPASFGFSWPSQPRLAACFTCILKVLEVGDVLGLDAKALELVYLPAVKP